MAGLSKYSQQQLLNHLLRQTSYASPSSVHVALFTADPTDDNILANEFQDSGYARQDATGLFDAPDFDGGFIVNNAAISFPAIVDGTVTATHVGIYDSATAGNLLVSQELTNPKTLAINDVLSFGIGALKVTAV
jgi:hypothetical protein